jgi:hypothetical protein
MDPSRSDLCRASFVIRTRRLEIEVDYCLCCFALGRYPGKGMRIGDFVSLGVGRHNPPIDKVFWYIL